MSKILLGTDEFTIIIFPVQRSSVDEWEFKAERITENLFDLLMLEEVFDGEKSHMSGKLPAGYNVGYDVGIKDFYFAVSYNSDNPGMAVCLRFSAKAWAIYQARFFALYGDQIILPQLLVTLDNNMAESIRLSKVDFTADYYDCGINMDELYLGLKNDDIVVQDQDGRNRIKTVNCFEGDMHVETIYLGSRKGNSRGFLRIYDKRKEQISANGFRLQEALMCDEWVRFEAVFKGVYAHKITDTILNENMGAAMFSHFIAYSIASKYRFYDTAADMYMKFTEELIALIDSVNFDSLRLESPRDNSLRQNIHHIESGSGLYPTLYKIEKLYGKTAVDEFLKYLSNQYRDGKWISRSMHAELSLWLKKHSDLKTMKLEDNY